MSFFFHFSIDNALDALVLLDAETKNSESNVDEPTNNLIDDLEESPDGALNRENIAMGVTPIAARESVVKYQVGFGHPHSLYDAKRYTS
jgi:hypothetical protein